MSEQKEPLGATVVANLKYLDSTLTKKRLVRVKCRQDIKRLCTLLKVTHADSGSKKEVSAMYDKIRAALGQEKWRKRDIKPVQKRKVAIKAPLREKVWRTTMGNILDGLCPVCCQNEISPWNFECGHIKAESMGGNTVLNNLRAICGTCNKSMGAINMDQYMEELWKDSGGYPSDMVLPYERGAPVDSKVLVDSNGKQYPGRIKINRNTTVAGLYAQFRRFFYEPYQGESWRQGSDMESLKSQYESYLDALDTKLIKSDVDGAIRTLYDLSNLQSSNLKRWNYTLDTKFRELRQLFDKKCQALTW